MVITKQFNFQRLVILLVLFCMGCSSRSRGIALQPGMILKRSTKVQGLDYSMARYYEMEEPVLTISGENLVIDFQGATIRGFGALNWPNQFRGVAINVIDGKNITLKNINIHGFKLAILGDNVEQLTIENANLSHNYRQKLKSTREQEDLADWLSYHQNDQDEWLRYGAAIYLKDCDRSRVESVTVTGGQNGVMLTRCDEGLFYNNTIQFNSGVGLGMYRSSRNRIFHNKLDWNVRGYSHNFYSRGQDSAGILCYEQSNDNIFAYNSATHSGDGFFLWAGQTTMDSGRGGCNGNILYRNDFSFAPTNGVELTFSKNKVIENIIRGCIHGIWGGYSFHSDFSNNRLEGNDVAIAVEHGHNNHIYNNYFHQNRLGIKLWDTESPPSDWGFVQNNNVESRQYEIYNNLFTENATPLELENTERIIFMNNHLFDFGNVVVEKDNKRVIVKNNIVYQDYQLELSEEFWADNERKQIDSLPASGEITKQITQIEPLKNGQDAFLPARHPKGKSFILVNEWGPYDFSYPLIWLREIDGLKYSFLLLGPKGEWSVTKIEGFEPTTPRSGSFPNSIIAVRKPGADYLTLELTYEGEAFTDQFGQQYERGQPVRFTYRERDKSLSWKLRFYEYGPSLNPITDYATVESLGKGQPDFEQQSDNLAFIWWHSPGEDVDADHFITFAESAFITEGGTYIVTVTADDGVKLKLDGKLLIDEWDIHTPNTYEAKVQLEPDKRHRIELIHFEGGGLASLKCQLIKE